MIIMNKKAGVTDSISYWKGVLNESEKKDAPKKSDNPYYNAAIQKALNKLISEEWIAGNFYMQMVLACDPDERSVIADLFRTISNDEINDHLKELVEWAISHGYDVPAKISDFKKYASKDDVKRLDNFKAKQKADYYLEEAAKSEEAAMKSYTDALNIEGLVELTDLQSLLWHIYYDEEEHLRNVKTAMIAYSANVDMGIY